jgi:hypothetical protein
MDQNKLTQLSLQTAKSNTAIKLVDFLRTTIENGHKLPARKHTLEVNKSFLADLAGFDRQALDEKRGAKDTIKLLNWAIKNIELDSDLKQESFVRQSDSPDLKVLKKILDKQDREIHRLESLLHRAEAKSNSLVYEIKKLERYLSQKNEADTYISSGYKIVLFDDVEKIN